MYNFHPRRSISQLLPMLFFLSACLILLLVNPCSLLPGNEFLSGAPSCGLSINNQSGKTLRLTPISAEGDSFSAVRLYRNTYPNVTASQQRNISVEAGVQVFWSYDCSKQVVTALYACNLEGECYVNRSSHYVYPFTESGQDIGFTFRSLESLARPDAALEAAVGSFPEHNYALLKTVLLCSLGFLAMIGGIYTLVRARTVDIRKYDM